MINQRNVIFLLSLIIPHNLYAVETVEEPVIPPVIKSTVETNYNPLNSALQIVMSNSSAIEDQQNILDIIRGQKSSNWDVNTSVRTGYAQKTTQEFAPGIDSRGSINLTYTPTWGYETKDDKARAESIRKLNDTKLSIRNSFIQDCQSLTMLDIKTTLANRVHTIAMEKLKRLQKYNDGMIKLGKSNLKQPIDDAVLEILNNENAIRLAEHEFQTQLRNISIKWAFNEWQELERHTAKYVLSLRNLTLVQYNK